MSGLNEFLASADAAPEAPAEPNDPTAFAPASEEMNPDGGVPPADEPPESERPTPETPPEGLDKRSEAIWREERTRRKELQAQVEKMNERWAQMVERMQQGQPQAQQQPTAAPQPETEIPDFDDDPIGHLRVKNELLEKQLQEVNAERTARNQQARQIQEFQQLQSGVDQMETAFAQTNADYHDAVGYLYENVGKLAAAIGYNPQQVQQVLSQTAMNLSVSALRQGKNPAEAAYLAAKQMGWGGQQQVAEDPAPTPKPRAPTSLSSVAGRRTTGGAPTLDAIADMDDAEFNKLWADMEKTARKG
jgi:hypothetical protein